MKWTGIYFVGYVILMGGVIAALAKMGVLDRLGTEWTIILGVIAVGIGVMVAVANSGRKETIDIDHH